MNPWILLTIAGISEIAWALTLKFSEGYTKPLMVVINLIVMVFSLVLLSIALKSIPIGTAYAVWTAIGATGVAIVGMMFLGESSAFIRIFFILVIIIGIIGLKFTTP
ncbi:DMT family transporter [Methanobrevibacter filiformis]|uniref:Quaternary ammonium compound-resistance protein SugE n=1 Tax=Methanobrevibacter filiformis TaxID=55758 RepID=A0A166C635_9EURY|nr:multidrug efflux SMR transporter [Methanobrevibacter filiformis]KZX11537.1 quaternary ammonium compound-resistance protein SugE [Methanobrevibacter filiformis]